MLGMVFDAACKLLQAAYLLVRNVIQWIHWFAVLAQFKMQFVTVGVGIAQVGNGLTAFYSVIFFHQQALVVTIGGEEGGVVLHNNQIAIATQIAATVNHFAIGRCHNWLACVTSNINAFIGAVELGNHITHGRAHP